MTRLTKEQTKKNIREVRGDAPPRGEGPLVSEIMVDHYMPRKQFKASRAFYSVAEAFRA